MMPNLPLGSLTYKGRVLQLFAPDFLEIFRTARLWKDTQAPNLLPKFTSNTLKIAFNFHQKNFFGIIQSQYI